MTVVNAVTTARAVMTAANAVTIANVATIANAVTDAANRARLGICATLKTCATAATDATDKGAIKVATIDRFKEALESNTIIDANDLEVPLSAQMKYDYLAAVHTMAPWSNSKN